MNLNDFRYLCSLLFQKLIIIQFSTLDTYYNLPSIPHLI